MASSEPRDPATRVDRTIAFIDLSGFTHLTDEQGDDRAVSVLAEFRHTVRDVASRHGVRIAKWMGDGAMLIAVEPEPLLYALRAIAQRTVELNCPLSLRIGLTHGKVILFEGDDYIGRSVNLAARLCDLADGGQVLAPAAHLAVLPPGAASKSLGTRELPGFGGSLEVVDLALQSE